MKIDIAVLPCEIEVVTKRDNRLRVIETEWHAADLYDFYQYSKPIEPSMMTFGHQGGMVAYPVALIKWKDGKFDVVKAEKVKLITEEYDK